MLFRCYWNYTQVLAYMHIDMCFLMFAPRQCQCSTGIGVGLGKHRAPGTAVVGHDLDEAGTDAAVDLTAFGAAGDFQTESEW